MSRITAVFAVTFLVGLSGCATISVTTEVGDADTIERYEMNISTSTTVYGFINEAAKDDGYDSFRDQVLSGSGPDSEKIEYSEEISGDNAKISIRTREVPVENLSSITREEQDGQLHFEDRTFLNESAEETSSSAESFMSGLVVQYTLIMPNEITDSNADEVDGNEATWRRTGPDSMTNTSIRAQSDAPSGVAGPGFEPLVAVISILLSAWLIARRT